MIEDSVISNAGIMEMSFIYEQPDPGNWEAIHELLAPAIAHGGDTNAREIIDDLLTGRAQLWVKRTPAGAPLAAAVTSLDRETLHCQLLGGHEMQDWLDELIATVTARVRPAGVTRLTMDGRPGWDRVLSGKGWKRSRVVMELNL